MALNRHERAFERWVAENPRYRAYIARALIAGDPTLADYIETRRVKGERAHGGPQRGNVGGPSTSR
jgi:hypothetical protein